MSVSSWIDVNFADPTPHPLAVYAALVDAGWSPVLDGTITFLPLGDQDAFAWRSVPERAAPQFLEELQAKCRANEVLGVALVWKETACGGNFLIHPNGTFWMSLSIDRRLLSEDRYATDVNWYLQRLTAAFDHGKFSIESMAWTQRA